jgi:hypothetical protein
VSTFTWTNTAGGDWSVAADWSAVPTSISDVAITLPGIYTVTASVPETAQSVVVDDPGATLVLDASLTVADGFTLQAGTVVFAGSMLSVGTFEQDGGLLTGNTVDVFSASTMAFYGGEVDANFVTLTAEGSVNIPSVSSLLAVTWTNTAGGDWSVGGNWSGGVAPAAADDALITLPGSYTVTQSGTSAVADVVLDDPAGTLAVNGTLNAGTVTVSAGTLVAAPGGLVLAGPGGGPGRIVLGSATQDGSAAPALLFTGDSTLSSVGVRVVGAGVLAPAAVGDTLTIGQGTTLIDTAGSTAAVGGFTLGGAGNVINDGRVIVAGPGAFADVTGSFVSNGSIDVGGGTLEVDATASFANAGTIRLWGGDSTVLIGGSLSVAALGTVTGAGTIAVGGTLDNTGGTLSLVYPSPFANLQLGQQNSGVLQGGTVVSAGAPLASDFGVLSGVTWDGPLSLQGSFEVLGVRNGLSVVAPGGGPGMISLGGNGAGLVFLDNETLRNADVVLGNGAEFAAAASIASGSLVVADVTLAANTTLQAQSGTAVLAGGITNQGLIDDSFGSLTVDEFTPIWPPGTISFTSAGTPIANYADLAGISPSGAVFDNQGTILVNAGTAAVFNIDNHVTLHNEGLIAVGNGETMLEQPGAVVLNTGTISLGAGSTLETYQATGNLGTIALAGANAQALDLSQPNGLTATITQWAPGAELVFDTYINDPALSLHAGTLTVTQIGSAIATLVVGDLSLRNFAVFYSGRDTVVEAAGVSWAVPFAGNWNSIDWSTNPSPPRPGDDAFITDAGTVSVTDAEAVNTLLIDNAAAALTIAAGGTLSVATAITLQAGTLALDGGRLTTPSLIQDGGTIIGSAGTLDNVTDAWSGGAIIGDGGTLTLGPNFQLVGTQASGLFLTIGGTNGGAVANQGSIALGFLDTLTLGPQASNAGLIDLAGNFGKLVTDLGDNTGTIVLANSSDTLVTTSLSINPAGTVVTNGGTVLFQGQINNAGSTLTLTAAGLSGEIDVAGTITGGTVINPGTSLDFSNATLQDVVWEGALSANTGSLIVAGVTVQALNGGPGTITLGNASLALLDANGGTIQPATLDDLTLQVVGSAAALTGAVPAGGGGFIVGTDNAEYLIGPRGTVAVASPGATLTAGGYLLTNDGTIVVSGTSDAFVAQLYTVANNGLIVLSDGALFQAVGEQLYPGLSNTFDNTGQITISGGATLATNGPSEQFVNSGTITLADATSTLELGGTVTATALGTIDADGGILSIGGTLDNTGNTLVIGQNPGFSSLQFNGDAAWARIEGGTIVNTSTVGLAGAGILDNVVWQGPLVITGNDETATNIQLLNPSELQPAAGDGHRVVQMTGWGGNLIFGTGAVGENDVLSNYSIIDTAYGAGIDGPATLTLDATTTISIVGGTIPAGIISIGSGSAAPSGFSVGANTLINDGLITDSSTVGSDLSLGGGVFDNAGRIAVSGAGNALLVNSGSFVNTGTVLVTNGATLWLDVSPGTVGSGPLDNTGLISVDRSSTLEMAGSYTASQLASITTAGGPVLLVGTLDNSANTLSFAAGGELGNVTLGLPVGSGNPYAPGGVFPQLTIQGGTVVEAGGVVVVQDMTLDGVTWVGPLSLIEPNATLAVTNGSALLGAAGAAATISVTGAGAGLGFDSGVVADTTIDLGAAGGTVTLDVTNLLTLAADTTVDLTTPGAGQIDLLGNIANLGLINDQSGNLQIGLPPSTNNDPGGGGVIVTLYDYGEPPSPDIPYSPSSFDNQGTILATAGAGSTITIGSQASFSNEGFIQVNNGDHLIVQTASFSNTGTLAVGTGTIEFIDAIANPGTIAFTPGEAGVVIFDTPELDQAGLITNLGTGDRIEFGDGVGVFAADVTASGTVTIITSIGSIILGGVSFAAGAMQSFASGIDSTTGDGFITPTAPQATQAAPCFAAGTRIATPRGQVAVEHLRIGDLVQTVLGDTLAPITWVGRRKVDCARHPNPGKVWPVRIAAGAFGSNRPHTDLFLSPDHAVYVNGVLIPIKHLINGSTITQAPTDQVTYHHLELPLHDVLLAEGLPSESFLDLRDGSNYANRPGPVRLYPDFSARMWEAFGCARLVVTGPELQAARALVAGFAAARAAA